MFVFVMTALFQVIFDVIIRLKIIFALLVIFNIKMLKVADTLFQRRAHDDGDGDGDGDGDDDVGDDVLACY